jgi:hypothetical protein
MVSYTEIWTVPGRVQLLDASSKESVMKTRTSVVELSTLDREGVFAVRPDDVVGGSVGPVSLGGEGD